MRSWLEKNPLEGFHLCFESWLTTPPQRVTFNKRLGIYRQRKLFSVLESLFSCMWVMRERQYNGFDRRLVVSVCFDPVAHESSNL